MSFKEMCIVYYIVMGSLLLFVLSIGVIATYNTFNRDPHRGCIASAYQATTSGFSLEENLKACENI